MVGTLSTYFKRRIKRVEANERMNKRAVQDLQKEKRESKWKK